MSAYGESIGIVDYKSSANLSQIVKVPDASRVVIACYCRSYTVARDWTAKDLVLNIAGTFEIDGYHGSLEYAGARPLAATALRFEETRSDRLVRLESPEWTVLHHSLVIDSLQLTAPGHMDVRVEPISMDELRGRGRAK